jgi:hypothetical protein
VFGDFIHLSRVGDLRTCDYHQVLFFRMGYGARRGAALGREARRSNLHVRHAMLAVCALATVHILHRLLSMYRAPVERLSLPVLSRVELPEYRPTAFPPPHAKPLTTGHPVVPIRTARACFNASWTRGGVDCRMADRKHTTYVPESHSKRVLPLPMLAQPPLVVLTFAGGPQARQLLPLFLHSMQHASAATLRATVVLNTDMPALALCLELHVDESLCVLFTDGGAQLHDLERLKSEKSRLHYKFLSLMWDKVDVIMVRGRSSCLVCLDAPDNDGDASVQGAAAFYRQPVLWQDLDAVWLRDPWTELAAARAGSPRVWVATNGDIKRGRDFNVGTVLVDGSVAPARKFMRLWFSRRGWAMQDSLRRHEQDSLTILQDSGTIGDSIAVWQCRDVMTACCFRPRHGNLTARGGPVLFHAACVDSAVKKQTLELVQNTGLPPEKLK